MFLPSPCSCLCPVHWSQVLSQEWRCSWSSAGRRCSNYILMINNFIAYQCSTYIRGFMVIFISMNVTNHHIIRLHDKVEVSSQACLVDTIRWAISMVYGVPMSTTRDKVASSDTGLHYTISDHLLPKKYGRLNGPLYLLNIEYCRCSHHSKCLSVTSLFVFTVRSWTC